MGNASGGDPGPSRINNVKNLLQKTRKKYQLINSKDKRWPCPFCPNKAQIFMKCRTHIINEHGISSTDFSQSNVEESKICEIESQGDFQETLTFQCDTSSTDDQFKSLQVSQDIFTRQRL